jgi:hypothetical protein
MSTAAANLSEIVRSSPPLRHDGDCFCIASMPATANMAGARRRTVRRQTVTSHACSRRVRFVSRRAMRAERWPPAIVLALCAAGQTGCGALAAVVPNTGLSRPAAPGLFGWIQTAQGGASTQISLAAGRDICLSSDWAYHVGSGMELDDPIQTFSPVPPTKILQGVS